jgi:hypothetical protein
MNFDDSDGNASDTSGGVPTDPEDDDEDMPAAPTLTAATVPSTRSRAAPVVCYIPSFILIC